MKRLILMMIRELVNFVDVIDIPDQIEQRDYAEIERITSRIGSRIIFAPFYRVRESRVSGNNGASYDQ